MKKLVVALSIVMGVGMTAPKSQAGVVLAMTPPVAVSGLGAIVVVFGLAQAVSTAFEGRGGLWDLGSQYRNLAFGAGLLVLGTETENNSSTASLENLFAKKYPFIEDKLIIRDLVEQSLENSKFESVSGTEAQVLRLTEEKILDILSPMDLTGLEKEVAVLVSDLK
jgi:hypothetical protein